MKIKVSKFLLSLPAFVAFGLYAAPEEWSGEVVALGEGSARIQVENIEDIKIGDWTLVLLGDGSEITKQLRGEVLQIVEGSIIAKIDDENESLEIGQIARIVSRAPALEADLLGAIPNDTFAVSEGIRNETVEIEDALTATRTAIQEYPEEPRFHAQYGRLLEIDGKPASAILSYERTIDLEPNYAVVLHNLATLRHFGPEELRNYETSRKLYRRSAELGHEASMPVIAAMLRDAQGGDRDFGAAVQWFERAANQGNAFSQNALAQCYENEWGLDRDISKALLWYRSSAELDFAPAMRNLGRVFRDGVGVAQNLETSFRWFRKAADVGDIESQFNLGLCYLQGSGVAQSKSVALEWLNKAAANGNAKAMREIASVYYIGDDGKRDYELAAAWYGKAAENGDMNSQYQLAVMLEKGLGLDRDKNQAIAYYKTAARQGDNLSQKRLLQLKEEW